MYTGGNLPGRFRGVLAHLLTALRCLEDRMLSLRRRLMPAELVCFEDITGTWFATALATAVRLGLPDKIGEGRRVEELAKELGIDAQALQRLLEVLVGNGYFKWRSRREEIVASSLSRALSKGRAGAFCALQAESWYRDCFDPKVVIEAMRRSEHPFKQQTGHHFFEVLSKDPNKGELFAEAMAEITEFVAPWLSVALDISPGSRVLDVGGGNGRLCAILARAHPDCRFGVLDIHAEGDFERVTYVQGDFLKWVPAGFDHLLLKNVLHDWGDETAQVILERCASAVVPGARLSVMELILPEDGSGGGRRDFQVHWNVYCTLGGRERRLNEFRALFERTGWRFERVLSTATPLWILEATRL